MSARLLPQTFHGDELPSTGVLLTHAELAIILPSEEMTPLEDMPAPIRKDVYNRLKLSWREQ